MPNTKATYTRREESNVGFNSAAVWVPAKANQRNIIVPTNSPTKVEGNDLSAMESFLSIDSFCNAGLEKDT